MVVLMSASRLHEGKGSLQRLAHWDVFLLGGCVKRVAGERRSFHYCGLFSNIQEQLCVQFIEVVASKLVSVITLQSEGPLSIFPVGFKLRLASHGNGVHPGCLTKHCTLRMAQGVCESVEGQLLLPLGSRC